MLSSRITTLPLRGLLYGEFRFMRQQRIRLPPLAEMVNNYRKDVYAHTESSGVRRIS
jgi:hypothetical protein